MKNFLPFIVFIILAVFLFIGLSLDSKKIPSPFINKKFPDLIVSDFNSGKKYQIHDVFKNKMTLVNFWASWCVTCRVEHKMLKKIYSDKKLQMLGINYKDKKQDANLFLSRLGNPFDIIVSDKNGSIGLNLGVYAMPESFLVDKNGIIVYKHLGEITNKIYQQEILPFIR